MYSALQAGCIIGPDPRYLGDSEAFSLPPPTRREESSETSVADTTSTGTVSTGEASTSTGGSTSWAPDTSTSASPVTSSGPESSETSAGESTSEAWVSSEDTATAPPTYCDEGSYFTDDFVRAPLADEWVTNSAEYVTVDEPEGALRIALNGSVARSFDRGLGDALTVRLRLHNAPNPQARLLFKLSATGNPSCFLSFTARDNALLVDNGGNEGSPVPFSLSEHRWLELHVLADAPTVWSFSSDGSAWNVFAESTTCLSTTDASALTLEVVYISNGGAQDGVEELLVDSIDVCAAP